MSGDAAQKLIKAPDPPLSIEIRRQLLKGYGTLRARGLFRETSM